MCGNDLQGPKGGPAVVLLPHIAADAMAGRARYSGGRSGMPGRPMPHRRHRTARAEHEVNGAAAPWAIASQGITGRAGY